MNEATILTEKDIAPLFPKRPENAHKGNFGYVGLLGGSPEYGGAVKLSNLALSALRAGAGVARLIIPAGLFPSVSPYILESTLYLLPDGGSGRLVFSEKEISNAAENLASLAFGMGVGQSGETLKTAQYLLTSFENTLILDADALNAIAVSDKSKLKARKFPAILTPHVKEMSRLCGASIDEILEKPQETAENFAREYGVIVLLKGHITYVTDGRKTYAVKKGSAGMATGGSGDVLSGIIAGLCGFAKDPLLAAAAGAFINGTAGEKASNAVGEYGMLPSDTVNYIAETVKSLGETV